jgi:hypothetical protein
MFLFSRAVFALVVAPFFFLAGEGAFFFLGAPLLSDDPVPFRFTTFFFFVLGAFVPALRAAFFFF